MKTILLLTLPFLFLTSCKKETCEDGIKNQDETDIDCGGVCSLCPITYPDNGHYGVNILDVSTTTFYLAPEYSLHAQLPAETSIRIEFTNTSSNILSEIWWLQPSSNVNLIVSNYNESTGVQTFESVAGALEIDLRMSFSGSGTATIEVYENDATSPTRTKLINW
jgi:hypothetical protein